MKHAAEITGKNRKAKSTPLGIMTEAPVPRVSPKIRQQRALTTKKLVTFRADASDSLSGMTHATESTYNEKVGDSVAEEAIVLKAP